MPPNVLRVAFVAFDMVKSYAEAGVDIDAKQRQVEALVAALTFKRKGVGRPFGGIGAFTGSVSFGDHVLSLCTDSVGTKILVAAELGQWDTIGIDCVGMNANDMITAGIEPVAFVDYVAVDRYDADVARRIGVGLNRGAEMANLTIVGGEIAVVPEIVRGYDLAGTCLGIAKRKDVVDGRRVRAGDVIIGVSSTGIHSNGLTLARRVFRDAGLSMVEALPGARGSVGDALLKPQAIYVRPVMRVVRRHEVHGMANITGGGLRNLVRLKKGLEFRITEPVKPPPIFRTIQALAGIKDAEMYQTFNMGMGYAIVAPEDEASGIVRDLRPFAAKVVGKVVRGQGATLPDKGLVYTRY
jgi:phosphoribosylformylglycinamidine cyclo-ligase